MNTLSQRDDGRPVRGMFPRVTAIPPEIASELEGESPEERSKLARAWEVSGTLTLSGPSDEKLRQMGSAIWANLETQIAQETRRPQLRLVKSASIRWVAIAACITLLLAIGSSLYLRPVSLHVPRGETASVRLPDGSTVQLNSGASLTYPRLFLGSERSVDLEGEAFFDVTKNGKRFVVHTFNAQVAVLGTEFNVRAWPGENGTAVVLKSGKVELSSNVESGKRVILKPGEQSQIVAHGAPTSPVHVLPEQSLAWREGAFRFEEQPLSTIASELERRFDVTIRLDNPELADDKLTVLYDKGQNAESILRDICTAQNYSYRKIPGGYVISRDLSL